MSPATQSGAPPPRERPASNDSSRDEAARQTQDKPPARRAVTDVSTLDYAPSAVPAALRRRRAAAWRCEPLPDGRRRDPLEEGGCDEPITGAQLISWRAAWRHLHRLGLPAIIPQRVVAAGQAHRREVA